MQRFVVANWKLNPLTEKEAIRLARASDARSVVICPPFPFLPTVRRIIQRASLGAQDVFTKPHGAFTGEVSAVMLKNLGVRYVIVGHSERRKSGEKDAFINEKLKAVLAAGLTPILCVGEPLTVRRRGLGAVKQFVRGQLSRGLRGVPSKKVIVAYEPVWAIGTGRPDDPKESAEMARFIKKTAHVRRVLYGGSVTNFNISRILTYNEIDGALVGGASIKTKEFTKIITIANKRT